MASNGFRIRIKHAQRRTLNGIGGLLSLNTLKSKLYKRMIKKAISVNLKTSCLVEWFQLYLESLYTSRTTESDTGYNSKFFQLEKMNKTLNIAFHRFERSSRV